MYYYGTIDNKPAKVIHTLKMYNFTLVYIISEINLVCNLQLSSSLFGYPLVSLYNLPYKYINPTVVLYVYIFNRHLNKLHLAEYVLPSVTILEKYSPII
jgi:hypothetical protein